MRIWCVIGLSRADWLALLPLSRSTFRRIFDIFWDKPKNRIFSSPNRKRINWRQQWRWAWFWSRTLFCQWPPTQTTSSCIPPICFPLCTLPARSAATFPMTFSSTRISNLPFGSTSAWWSSPPISWTAEPHPRRCSQGKWARPDRGSDSWRQV